MPQWKGWAKQKIRALNSTQLSQMAGWHGLSGDFSTALSGSWAETESALTWIKALVYDAVLVSDSLSSCTTMFLFIYLKFQRRRERERLCTLICCLFPRHSQWLPWDQAHPRNQKFNLDESSNQEGPNYRHYQVLIPWCTLVGNWNQEQTLMPGGDLCPGTLI